MRKGKNKLTKQAFAVVVDGQTEYWYLQMLKQNEPNILFGWCFKKYDTTLDVPIIDIKES